jgi:hypothetical protein
VVRENVQPFFRYTNFWIGEHFTGAI